MFVPEYGCHQCDSCTHALLDTTDSLRALIDPVILDFDVSSYLILQRLVIECLKTQFLTKIFGLRCSFDERFFLICFKTYFISKFGSVTSTNLASKSANMVSQS